MNFYDSEKMSDLLMNHGYATTDTQEDADLIIVNTCHIREKASEKLFSDLGRIKKIKDKKRISVAVILGGILGPIFYFISQEWCILFGGVIAGTIAFLIGEKNVS